MKKGLKKLAVILAAVSLTGCQNDTPPEPEITDVPIPKLLMDTDKPFVLAEKQYLIEKRDIDVSILNEYGYKSWFADGKHYHTEPMRGKRFYELNGQDPVEEASIFVYDYESGEYSLLYSEAPSSELYALEFEVVGSHENFLYYYRKEAWPGSQTNISEGLDLCRLNLDDKKSEHISSLNNSYLFVRNNITVIGGSAFFEDYFEKFPGMNEFVRAICQFDLDTGEVSVFRENAEHIMPYKNGMAYFRRGKYYYHEGAADNTGDETSDNGDELIFDSGNQYEKLFGGFYAKGDTAVYTYRSDTDQPSRLAGITMGIIDKDFNRIDIASTKNDTWFIDVNGCSVSESGLISVGGAPKPLIYDTDNECFAVISIDDYSDYISYAAEDGIYFFGYDRDNDGMYTSAALYTVERRKD